MYTGECQPPLGDRRRLLPPFALWRKKKGKTVSGREIDQVGAPVLVITSDLNTYLKQKNETVEKTAVRGRKVDQIGVSTLVLIHLCMYLCVCVFLFFIHLCVHGSVCACVCVCMHVYVYVCVYIGMHLVCVCVCVLHVRVACACLSMIPKKNLGEPFSHHYHVPRTFGLIPKL